MRLAEYKSASRSKQLLLHMLVAVVVDFSTRPRRWLWRIIRIPRPQRILYFNINRAPSLGWRVLLPVHKQTMQGSFQTRRRLRRRDASMRRSVRSGHPKINVCNAFAAIRRIFKSLHTAQCVAAEYAICVRLIVAQTRIIFRFRSGVVATLSQSARDRNRSPFMDWTQ